MLLKNKSEKGERKKLKLKEQPVIISEDQYSGDLASFSGLDMNVQFKYKQIISPRTNIKNNTLDSCFESYGIAFYKEHKCHEWVSRFMSQRYSNWY